MNKEAIIRRLIEFAEKHPQQLVRVQSDELLEVARIAEARTAGEAELLALLEEEARRRGVPKLDASPARLLLLTDRECAKIVGSLIGGLTEIAGLEAIRRAVQWWANHDDPWEALRHTLAPDRLVG